MKHCVTAAVLTVATTITGCSSSGLSPREVPGRTQSAMLYSMYDNLDVEASGPARPLKLPATVAVVQVGEVSPPQGMMDALRAEPNVFSRVESIPGAETYVQHDVYRRGAAQAPSRPTTAGLRRLAADLGMDYVLLVGGTMDYDSNGTPMSLFDLTIVGAFIIPSRETHATARANAALIDVKTGRVVASSSAEDQASSIVPAGSIGGEQVKLLEKLRDKVVAKLGTQVLADAKHRALQNGAAAAAMR
jgi:hypothetical protein